MATFTTVNLTNLSPDRELFRMLGNRFMEILYQPAAGGSAEYSMMRVVDMGVPGDAPVTSSTTQILPNNLPFNPKDFVIGVSGLNTGATIGADTVSTYNRRGYYGAHVPMSSTELLITHSPTQNSASKLYRFTYDEGTTGDIIFDGEVTQVGGSLPDMERYGDAVDSGYTFMTVMSGMIRMGTSNSFIAIRQPRMSAHSFNPSTKDNGAFQIWEYDSVANTITLKYNTDLIYNTTKANAYVKEIPGSNSVFVAFHSYNYSAQDDITYSGPTINIDNDSYIFNTDGTFTNLDTTFNSPISYYTPLPLSTTQVWWVRNNTAIYVDYSNTANNKTINFAAGTLPFTNATYPNDGWAVSDTEFVAARNLYDGRIELMAVKDTGYGFGEFSPNGKITIGSDKVNVSSNNDYEAQFVDFHHINGDGRFGNALYRVDANTYQFDMVVNQQTASPGGNDATLHRTRIKRA